MAPFVTIVATVKFACLPCRMQDVSQWLGTCSILSVQSVASHLKKRLAQCMAMCKFNFLVTNSAIKSSIWIHCFSYYFFQSTFHISHVVCLLLSPKQQSKMAAYCVNIFGDMLLDKALDEYPVSKICCLLRGHLWKGGLSFGEWKRIWVWSKEVRYKALSFNLILIPSL